MVEFKVYDFYDQVAEEVGVNWYVLDSLKQMLL